MMLSPADAGTWPVQQLARRCGFTCRGKIELLEKELLGKERLWSLSSAQCHSCSDDHSHTA